MKRAARVAFTLFTASLLTVPGVPGNARAGAAPLGAARGVRSAELSLDGTSGWLSLAGRSLPLMADARIRSTTGVVAVDLADGSRLTLMPFTAARFTAHETAALPAGRGESRSGAAAGAPAEVVLEYGRLGLRLPSGSQVRLATSNARLEPSGGEAAVGELVAGPAGTTGVRMTRGSLVVHEQGGLGRTLRAGRDPLFVPERPSLEGPLFSADVPASPPAGARPVYAPQGENVGYLVRESRLVVQPGYARDLSGAYAGPTVQQAIAKVPPTARGDALVLFDADAAYVGYVRGAAFFAPTAGRAAAQPPVSAAAPMGSSDRRAAGIAEWEWHYTVGLLAVVGGIAAAVAAGESTNDAPASPLGP